LCEISKVTFTILYVRKEEALDRTMLRNRFGGGFGPAVRQNTEWMTSGLLKEAAPHRMYFTFLYHFCISYSNVDEIYYFKDISKCTSI